MNDEKSLSEQQLTTAYWYVTHRARLRKVGVLALVALSVALWGFAIARFSYFLLVEEPRTRAAVAALPYDLVSVRSHLVPREDLVVRSVDAFSSSDGRTDVYAEVQNPNGEYAARSFIYRFIYDGGETPDRVGYALPGDTFFLAAFDVPSSAVRNPQLEIREVAWKRVLGWEERKAMLVQFPVRDIAVAPITADARGGIAITFDLANGSIYNFWSVDIFLALLRGDRVIGVNALRLDRVASGTHRPVTFQWFGAPAGATGVRVTPYVNVLDPSVFEKVGL